jgi:hypothetical protein
MRKLMRREYEIVCLSLARAADTEQTVGNLIAASLLREVALSVKVDNNVTPINATPPVRTVA